MEIAIFRAWVNRRRAICCFKDSDIWLTPYLNNSEPYRLNYKFAMLRVNQEQISILGENKYSRRDLLEGLSERLIINNL